MRIHLQFLQRATFSSISYEGTEDGARRFKSRSGSVKSCASWRDSLSWEKRQQRRDEENVVDVWLVCPVTRFRNNNRSGWFDVVVGGAALGNDEEDKAVTSAVGEPAED